jgi:hypothetical protein
VQIIHKLTNVGNLPWAITLFEHMQFVTIELVIADCAITSFHLHVAFATLARVPETPICNKSIIVPVSLP